MYAHKLRFFSASTHIRFYTLSHFAPYLPSYIKPYTWINHTALLPDVNIKHCNLFFFSRMMFQTLEKGTDLGDTICRVPLLCETH